MTTPPCPTCGGRMVTVTRCMACLGAKGGRGPLSPAQLKRNRDAAKGRRKKGKRP